MTQLTLADRIIGSIYAPYKTRALQHRLAQAEYSNEARRAARQGRLDRPSASQQPWGLTGTRTLPAYDRRTAVQRSRQIYENNVLGRAMLDRATDNIIGEGMYVRPNTGDKGFDAEIAAFWEQYQADSRGLVDNGTHQRRVYRDWKRDGDVGGLMLNSGRVQIVESDLIQSPNGSGDLYNRGNLPEIVDGFKLSPDGRPIEAYIESVGANGGQEWVPIAMDKLLYIADTDRDDYTAIRGVPVLATIGWLLEQIDGTIEAVTIAHRMSAMFGLVRKAESPGKTLGTLPTSRNAKGDQQAQLTMEPGSISYLGMGEDVVQVKPEHPTTSYAEFMKSLVRFAGLNLGLPLELALMDFSETNYSSARASMEQAYRGFRIQQRRFANCWLSKWYRWRIAKAVNDGDIRGAVPADFLRHDWYGQPWPYLNPVDDAEGTMALIGAGKTTLTEELAKRGLAFEDWVDIQKQENDLAVDAGVILQRSTKTRDVVPGGGEPDEVPVDGDQDIEL